MRMTRDNLCPPAFGSQRQAMMPSGSRTEKREATKELSTAREQSHITETRVILETDHLSRVMSGKRLVDDITIGIQKGEVLAVVGPSGSGKSSFLRLLNRLDERTSGTVYLEGTDYRQIPHGAVINRTPSDVITALASCWGEF